MTSSLPQVRANDYHAQMTGQAPSVNDIERMARAALAALPEMFRAQLGDIVLRIEEFADDDVLGSLGIDNPYALSGLYHGCPIGEKSSMDSGSLPDMILLYRRPILEEWIESGGDLEALVNHVLVHEVGHHFGLSDADMHRLEHES